MSQENYSVLVDAKQEYNHQIVNILSSGILKGIKSIYFECENMCQQENTPENVLMVFQDKLSKVPKWTLAKIEQEYQLVKKESQCDWIDDLLKVIYVTHIKILSLVNKVKKKGRLNIKVPTGAQFLHICYVNVAREMWKNPYLCSSHVSRYEQQKNNREMERLIKDTIMDTLRQQLPVKNIIQDFLDMSEKEDLSLVTTPVEHEDLDNPESKTNLELKNTKYMDKLENIVKEDLEDKYTAQPKSKKRDRFANLQPDKVKRVLQSSKVEPSIPLYNLEEDLNEINLEELIVEDTPPQVEEPTKEEEVMEEPVKEEVVLEDALNPELNEVDINGDKLVEEVMNNTNVEENVVDIPKDNTRDVTSPLPPSYTEIDTSLPLELEQQNSSSSLDSLLSKDEKDELSLSNEEPVKDDEKPVKEEVEPVEENVAEVKDEVEPVEENVAEMKEEVEPVKDEELLSTSSFDKPKTSSSKTRTVGRFQIDELDNIDLEVDELPNIDLQEMSNKQREVQTTSIQPKKKFTFFTDAPHL